MLVSIAPTWLLLTSLHKFGKTFLRISCLRKIAVTWILAKGFAYLPSFFSQILDFIYLEGRTGVFSWCVISWFYFAWSVNLGNYSSWFVTWRFCVIREEPEILIDIRDFTTQFYVILRRKFSEWLQWSIESALGMRFAIWSLDLAIRHFASFKHCF